MTRSRVNIKINRGAVQRLGNRIARDAQAIVNRVLSESEDAGVEETTRRLVAELEAGGVSPNRRELHALVQRHHAATRTAEGPDDDPDES